MASPPTPTSATSATSTSSKTLPRVLCRFLYRCLRMSLATCTAKNEIHQAGFRATLPTSFAHFLDSCLRDFGIGSAWSGRPMTGCGVCIIGLCSHDCAHTLSICNSCICNARFSSGAAAKCDEHKKAQAGTERGLFGVHGLVLSLLICAGAVGSGAVILPIM
jgi:hypothetical protein